MRFEKVEFWAFRKDMLQCGWSEECIMDAYENIRLPQRKTAQAAGYDFFTPIGFALHPKHKIMIPTGIKIYFNEAESKVYHLSLYVRSSIGIKKDVVLSNGTGIIDGDYYGNPDNDGDMLMAFYNRGNNYIRFEAGDRLMQGVVELHGRIEGDDVQEQRRGGVGSTNG